MDNGDDDGRAAAGGTSPSLEPVVHYLQAPGRLVDWQLFSRGLFSVSPLSLLCLSPTSPCHVSAESGDYVDHSL